MWLALKNCLTTGERLQKWGYQGAVLCWFCHRELESRDHLFFNCGFSGRLWKTGLAECNVHNHPSDWDSLVPYAIKEWNNKLLKAIMCRLVLCATVYNLCRNRNELKYGINL
jgi:hypothetical protein